MAVRKSGLGKGLDSLIMPTATKAVQPKKTDEKAKKVKNEEENTTKGPVSVVKLSLVEPNREQPRKSFEEDALLELADSIKQFGVLQPLLVQKKEDYYEIIAGERRWRAAKLAGLKEVPVIVKEFTEQETLEISLIENIQRENLNPIEEAMAYKRLLEEFHLKQEDIAERVSKSRVAVTNAMRLLKLDENVQKMVVENQLSTGHARALLAIIDTDAQYAVAKRVFEHKLSVRETEKLVKDLVNPKKKTVKQPDLATTAIYETLEERMKSILGTKVSIHPQGKNKGKIEIEYYSDHELDRIIDLMQTIEL